jgi:two-component system sensor histidine kinase RegB
VLEAVRTDPLRPIADASESRLRLLTSVKLRWVAVLGQLSAVGFVYLGLGFHLPIGPCLLLIALMAWVNVFLRAFYPARHRLGNRFATCLLAFDILQLGALLYLTGGADNPFMFLIVAPVMVSATTQPAFYTLLLAMLAMALTTSLAVFSLPLPWTTPDGLSMPLLYRIGEVAAVSVSMLFLTLYTARLTKEAREMSAALAATELVLAREQRLHALDGLAAAAAHEFGTPLGTIVLVTKELMRDMPAADPRAEDIALLNSQALRCREILQKLTRQPASGRDPMHAAVPVTQLIDEAAAPYRQQGKVVSIDAGPTVETDPVAAHVPVADRRPGVIYGLGNLIENAVGFARSTVKVTARWSAREVEVTIVDDGPGFDETIIDALGEPYVTTRPMAPAPRGLRPEGAGAGLGLGFFIAKVLLERSGASLAIANRTGEATGAEVRITWPRSAFEAAAELVA